VGRRQHRRARRGLSVRLPTALRGALAALALAGLGASGALGAGLVDAAAEHDRAGVLAALESGEAATAAAADGTTALHWAVYHDDVELARRLIVAGADVAASNTFGATPLG